MGSRLESGSGGAGLALMLALAPTFHIDLPFWLRIAMMIGAITLVLWAIRPTRIFGRDIKLTPAIILMLVCLIGLIGGGVWELWSRYETRVKVSQPLPTIATNQIPQAHTAASAPIDPKAAGTPPVLEDSLVAREAFVRQLTHLYILHNVGVSNEMKIGLELPPADWLNRQLKERGKTWRVRNIHGMSFDSYNITQKEKPTAPAQQTVDSRGGIYNAAPNQGNQTVNNYGPPQRIVTPEQTSRFATTLKLTTPSPLVVVIRRHNVSDEALIYWKNLVAMVDGVGGIRVIPQDTPNQYGDVVGVVVALRDPQHPSPEVGNFLDAIRAAKIDFSLEPLPSWDDHTVRIMVGRPSGGQD